MSAAQEFMNECTALEIQVLKLKSEKSELLVACKLFIESGEAKTTDEGILDLMYANAFAAAKAAVKGATA